MNRDKQNKTTENNKDIEKIMDEQDLDLYKQTVAEPSINFQKDSDGPVDVYRETLVAKNIEQETESNIETLVASTIKNPQSATEDDIATVPSLPVSADEQASDTLVDSQNEIVDVRKETEKSVLDTEKKISLFGTPKSGSDTLQAFNLNTAKAPQDQDTITDSVHISNLESNSSLKLVQSSIDTIHDSNISSVAPNDPTQAEQIEYSPGKIFAERYKLLQKLGEGGMGSVYQVEDLETNEVLALKITIDDADSIDVASFKRFQREIASMKKLQHPNVMKVYDSGKDDGRWFYTMEYIEGKSMRAIRWQKATLSVAMEMMAKILDAVDYIHDNGIIHRDLKPENIIVTHDYKPILMDFGIAKVLEAETQLTKSGVTVGTPLYMSPEQALGEEIDCRSDVFALGAILYEFLTGMPPFIDDSPRGIMKAIIKDDPETPHKTNSKIPRVLSDICMKALEKEKTCRYSSAAEFSADVRKFINGEKTSVEQGSLITIIKPNLLHVVIHSVLLVIIIWLISRLISE